jgi:ribosomal protein S18 acetylase RimI-like enzyme
VGRATGSPWFNTLQDVRNARVSAEVKMSNIASRRIFRKLGFEVIDSQGELLMYAKDFL